jgi:hypothetical protein
MRHRTVDWQVFGLDSAGLSRWAWQALSLLIMGRKRSTER